MITTLYYVHDPMCSWCYAFRPVWERVKAQLPEDLRIAYLLGGLAPDSYVPMPDEMQVFLQQTWKKIQENVPGTQFNFDFWNNNTPRRSTYPACRAVIAARIQDADCEEKMIHAIQDAYYLEAINPSDDENLVTIAHKLGLNTDQFTQDLNSKLVNKKLHEEIAQHQRLGAQGFPSLILSDESKTQYISSSYTDVQFTLNNILEKL